MTLPDVPSVTSQLTQSSRGVVLALFSLGTLVSAKYECQSSKFDGLEMRETYVLGSHLPRDPWLQHHDQSR